MTDKFTYQADDILQVSICPWCKHKNNAPTCAAFPKGIPAQFLNGSDRHVKSIEGDNGITFERCDPSLMTPPDNLGV